MGEQQVIVRGDPGVNGLVVSLSGRLELATVPDARLAVHRFIDDGQGPIRLDLGACIVADGTALGMLVEALRRADRLGRPLLIQHADERTRRLLRRIRLGRLLRLLECEHHAAPRVEVACA